MLICFLGKQEGIVMTIGGIKVHKVVSTCDKHYSHRCRRILISSEMLSGSSKAINY